MRTDEETVLRAADVVALAVGVGLGLAIVWFAVVALPQLVALVEHGGAW